VVGRRSVNTGKGKLLVRNVEVHRFVNMGDGNVIVKNVEVHLCANTGNVNITVNHVMGKQYVNMEDVYIHVKIVRRPLPTIDIIKLIFCFYHHTWYKNF
jgi:hypothetical protein